VTMMIFRQFAHNSDDYQHAWELRQRVLRAPMGLTLAPEEREAEVQHLHFGLFDDNGNLLACVSAVPQRDGVAKIRQMAVDPKTQGSGAGRQLMTMMEQALAKKGFTQFYMHARISARGFYEKLGYGTVGAEFEEVTVPHIKMQKSL
jgi:predicted GNAT family N-acyltransferase